ncbi:hypothetical protein BD408DRAFT_425287 [Parasitella parasitica]|nr:hypothetical protein BD408DRAFT_425287 [Parasitella parasitica]
MSVVSSIVNYIVNICIDLLVSVCDYMRVAEKLRPLIICSVLLLFVVVIAEISSSYKSSIQSIKLGS